MSQDIKVEEQSADVLDDTSEGNQDLYGFGSLASILRSQDPTISNLTLGHGLYKKPVENEPMYVTFTSPFSTEPGERDPERFLPPIYCHNPPQLKISHFGKFTIDTLMYIFYSMPRDTLQSFAAFELTARGWSYSPSTQFWVSKDNNNVNVYFDYKNWKVKQLNDINIGQTLNEITVQNILKKILPGGSNMININNSNSNVMLNEPPGYGTNQNVAQQNPQQNIQQINQQNIQMNNPNVHPNINQMNQNLHQQQMMPNRMASKISSTAQQMNQMNPPNMQQMNQPMNMNQNMNQQMNQMNNPNMQQMNPSMNQQMNMNQQMYINQQNMQMNQMNNQNMNIHQMNQMSNPNINQQQMSQQNMNQHMFMKDISNQNMMQMNQQQYMQHMPQQHMQQQHMNMHPHMQHMGNRMHQNMM